MILPTRQLSQPLKYDEPDAGKSPSKLTYMTPQYDDASPGTYTAQGQMNEYALASPKSP